MGDVPDNHELARQGAVLEERMKTMQAENETLKGDLAATLSGMRADMAAHREDAAGRETRMIVTIVATVIGGGGLAVAFLAFLIGLPG